METFLHLGIHRRLRMLHLLVLDTAALEDNCGGRAVVMRSRGQIIRYLALRRQHLTSSVVLLLLGISQNRVLSLLLFVLIDALKDSIHLLLQKQLELLDHKGINGAPLDEVRDEGLDCVTFINDDTLDTEVGNVNVDV